MAVQGSINIAASANTARAIDAIAALRKEVEKTAGAAQGSSRAIKSIDTGGSIEKWVNAFGTAGAANAAGHLLQTISSSLQMSSKWSSMTADEQLRTRDALAGQIPVVGQLAVGFRQILDLIGGISAEVSGADFMAGYRKQLYDFQDLIAKINRDSRGKGVLNADVMADDLAKLKKMRDDAAAALGNVPQLIPQYQPGATFGATGMSNTTMVPNPAYADAKKAVEQLANDYKAKAEEIRQASQSMRDEIGGKSFLAGVESMQSAIDSVFGNTMPNVVRMANEVNDSLEKLRAGAVMNLRASLLGLDQDLVRFAENPAAMEMAKQIQAIRDFANISGSLFPDALMGATVGMSARELMQPDMSTGHSLMQQAPLDFYISGQTRTVDPVVEAVNKQTTYTKSSADSGKRIEQLLERATENGLAIFSIQ